MLRVTLHTWRGRDELRIGPVPLLIIKRERLYEGEAAEPLLVHTHGQWEHIATGKNFVRIHFDSPVTVEVEDPAKQERVTIGTFEKARVIDGSIYKSHLADSLVLRLSEASSLWFYYEVQRDYPLIRLSAPHS